MDAKTEKERTSHGQLISVTRRDTSRLLEVYIKRSLSLNDGIPRGKRSEGRNKWVTKTDRQRKIRRHSSDPSIHLAPSPGEEHLDAFDANDASPKEGPETPNGVLEKPPKKSKKKKKKSSLWKSFLGLFSRKGSEEKEEEQGDQVEDSDTSLPQQAAETCLPPPVTPDNGRRRMSIKKRLTKRRLSLRSSSKREARKNLLTADDITEVESVVSVEPTNYYYEKVSEEMEKIVYEVQEKDRKVLTDEEVINRIIALTKQQGDAINDKLKENPTLSNFFQGMSYASFQQLADTYLETEASATPSDPHAVPSTAPELVKLAFTLDFTARIAGLSRQSVCHITGLGNRYLEDRFEYKQACTDHPWSEYDD
ncbi:uncharacterized protein LOC130108222 [Lampris incognitus]|uniref:uncharacterized protein LOC130108222 n=1 Tax=Lampris incognitus TaxID=2546036 RepID=UPI0024B4C01D|nr:uncharacterized protein LOC130108222 [Lampris incognitus]